MYDFHRVTGETLAEVRGPARMQLDGDDASARVDEVGRERALPGADVEHELAGEYIGGFDDPRGPFLS